MSLHAHRESSSSYRPDIDGLRAIAVLSVILYHLSNDLLPGGYFGVDVFFVISGYLISSIIYNGLSRRTFSIVNFYWRRILRIVPALLFSLAATTITAWVILLPSDLSGYGRSLLSTIFFVANIYFWRDSGYFSRAAEEKPLLHMWSLGVEEQFYILFPLFLILLFRFGRQAVFWGIVIVSAGSMAIHALLTAVLGSSPAFFLLPARAWELGAGAAIALLPWKRPVPASVATAAGIAGTLLIGWALWMGMPQESLIPPALPVVLGTSLVIWANGQCSAWAGKALALRPLVLVGLLSYSLYLWHWPIIVLAKYYLVRGLSPLEMAGCAALTFVMAALSWTYVEKPFRHGGLTPRLAGASLLAGSMALAAAGLAYVQGQGLPGRMAADVALLNSAVGTHYRCPVSRLRLYGHLGFSFGAPRACLVDDEDMDPMDASVVLLGNSHALMYQPAVGELLGGRDVRQIIVPLNSCLPTVTANISQGCIEAARHNLGVLLGHEAARLVIVGTTWPLYNLVGERGEAVDNHDGQALVAALDDLISRLAAAGKSVALIGPITTPNIEAASIASRELAFGHPQSVATSIPRERFDADYARAIAHFSGRDDVVFLRPDTVQCPQAECYFIKDGRSLFSDDNHLARLPVEEQFAPLFRQGLNGIVDALP